jgi:hypothetical protein
MEKEAAGVSNGRQATERILEAYPPIDVAISYSSGVDPSGHVHRNLNDLGGALAAEGHY